MILQANSLEPFPLADGSVHTCVTSPPYYGLRSYFADDHQHKGMELGLEATPEEYVEKMVRVFREVYRVLRDDGVCWLNLGDSYNGTPKQDGNNGYNDGRKNRDKRFSAGGAKDLKPKDLMGIPWRVAFALQQPYYTGKIKSEADRIWLAAMIDGEGCMFIHKRKVGQDAGNGYTRKHDSYGAGLEVANTHLAIIERCQQITGQGSITRQEKQSRHGNFRNLPLYRWHMRSNECRKVIREVYPYLTAKKHEARLLLGCPSSGEDAERAHAGLIALHNGKDAGIDFPEPESMYEPGWYLRSDCIWSKLNPMPESVTDRPTKAHEYLFLLAKRERYFYDAEAVKEEAADSRGTVRFSTRRATGMGVDASGNEGRPSDEQDERGSSRNRRTVWEIPTAPYSGAHFATFPPALVEPCILAGTSAAGVCAACGAPWERVTEREGETPREKLAQRGPAGYYSAQPKNGQGLDYAGGHGNNIRQVATIGWAPTCAHDAATVPAIVLDPFCGSGTTGQVARLHGRRFVGMDLSREYLSTLALPRAEGTQTAASLASLPLWAPA